MTNDTKAPERIWAWPTYSWLSGTWAQTRFPETAESYTRTTDATAALEAVRREAVEQERARITREMVSALGTQIFEDETFSEIMKWETDHD